MKNVPKEDKQIEEEGPCTSYSHQGDKERSRRKTPYFGGKKEERLSKLLPRSAKNISEYLKNIRRDMYRGSPNEFEDASNSIFSHSECEHVATHYDVQHS